MVVERNTAGTVDGGSALSGPCLCGSPFDAEPVVAWKASSTRESIQ